MTKLFLTLGSVAMALAVSLGAFGAHALENRLSPEMVEIFQTGVTYHFYHALSLLLVGVIAFHIPESATLTWSGWLMTAGILIFSGSLYVLATTGIRWLGAVTPLGGLCFIASWVLLAITFWKSL